MSTAAVALRRTAPGPRGQVLFGSAPAFKRDPIGLFLALQREFGDVARIRLGPNVGHLITHPDDVQHVLQTNNRNYCRGRVYSAFKMFFGEGLLTLDGTAWLQHRRITQPAFHRGRIEAAASVVTEATATMLERWQASAERGAPIDVVPEMMRLSQSVLGRTLLDTDLGELSDYLKPALPFVLKAISRRIFSGGLSDVVPRFIPTPHNRRVRQAHRILDGLVYRIIDQHRRGSSASNDVVRMLLEARDERTGQPLTDAEVHDEIMNIFLAGYETTGTALSWTLYALSRYPAVRRALESELACVLAGRPPVVADLPQLPYTRMVVEESLRVYPPIWGYPRDAVEEDEIGGYRIPAGSTVFLSAYVTHRHRDFWDNPEAFDPERFTPERAATRPRFAYFPFGGGQRQCIGSHMALLQLQLAIPMILQHYDLHAVPGYPVAHGALLSLHPRDGIPMTLHPRTGVR